MPRVYSKTTDRERVSEGAMRAAVAQVLSGDSLADVSDEQGIPKTTLFRYVKAAKANPEAPMCANFRKAQIFSEEAESLLADYLIKCSKMFHGLTPKQARKMSWELAVKNRLSMPAMWNQNEMAGKDWLTGFLKRNPRLSIRSPEATSMARATAFNKSNVEDFYNRLEALLGKLNVTGKDIYNLDESGFTTVQNVPKVIASKGSKQVGQTVSRERGELVTVCAIVSADGNSIPPAFVFPRVKLKAALMHGAPEGSLGMVNPSGWIKNDLFKDVMQHIVDHTRCSKDRPMILIMDNHDSHLDIAALELAKSNGIHILTLPPHTSNKLQPLDRTVFGPLKKLFNDEANSWMMRHPGQE